jgi:hypothetical protein
VVAVALYVALLANATYKPAGGGEAAMGQAFEMLYLAFGLWVVLVCMLVVGGVMGSMPRWAAWLAIVLVPMAAVADVTAIDMCSRHMEWAIVLVAVLPMLVGFYAFWARLPRLQAEMPAERTSVAVWGAIFFLSVLTFVVAAY